MLRLILGAVYTYVGVDVDLGRRFAGEPDELARVQLPHHHFAGFLDSAERLRRALVITVLHRLYLAEDFVGNPAHLNINEIGHNNHNVINYNPNEEKEIINAQVS